MPDGSLALMAEKLRAGDGILCAGITLACNCQSASSVSRAGGLSSAKCLGKARNHIGKKSKQPRPTVGLT